LDDRLHEAQLVLLAQAGDREALERLLKGIQAVLFKYIQRLVGPDPAEDVLQDVFLEICRHLRALQEPLFFRAWAYRISTRASFRLLRLRRAWQSRHEEEIEMDALPDNHADSALELFSEDVNRLLSIVSPASRAVMALHYLEGQTIQEVAAILQLSAGTVKSRLAYGLKCLRIATGKRDELHDRTK
jgi:RNA polymerase sigma-70 factor (ECF subfamily)